MFIALISLLSTLSILIKLLFLGHDNPSIFKIMLKYRYESKKTSM
ncbi:hypothetical protein [uncultured Gammaproteobacteria bacterium]|nr:hypothetical protein [uncultured Gammaproteobacteria bacterium]